ncbi:hypothetical protein E8E12_004681 [Didymella heteroderae]|uniref:Uncharacterized protein n=1 Tax=Didymella heteroderae TaxID=1769908 RepID=A0A9P4WQ97_9PLEO|nr:hypothetical protein E8E12_004681 [Didymella heteroderae]
MSPTYTGLCDVTAHLPAPHKRAITSLSVLSGSNPSGFLTNALLAFPSLRYFVVQTGGVYQADARTGKCRTSHASSGLTYPVGACDEATIQEPANRAVARYAPHALTSLLAAVASGKAYRWQTGEKWWVEWPQLESSCMYAHVRHDGDEDMVMDGGAVGEVNDVDMKEGAGSMYALCIAEERTSMRMANQ